MDADGIDFFLSPESKGQELKLTQEERDSLFFLIKEKTVASSEKGKIQCVSRSYSCQSSMLTAYAIKNIVKKHK